MLGGQNPITLEYQIYPPPIDTLVTGMMYDGNGLHSLASLLTLGRHRQRLSPQLPLVPLIPKALTMGTPSSIATLDPPEPPPDESRSGFQPRTSPSAPPPPWRPGSRPELEAGGGVFPPREGTSQGRLRTALPCPQCCRCRAGPSNEEFPDEDIQEGGNHLPTGVPLDRSQPARE